MIPLLLEHGSHGTRLASPGLAHKQKVVGPPAAIARVQDRSTIVAGDELIVLEHRDPRDIGSGGSGYDGCGSGGSGLVGIVCARGRDKLGRGVKVDSKQPKMKIHASIEFNAPSE